ncbi:MAG TPA: formyltetrahydrofolate deformylase [Pseudonocardia sp.]|uniref:formyltetrahydrofolate deformylase n=1 Tax=Pseudonocardia sp. TaxID=60912 RepID=UPI002BB7AB1E|nr:formyltetrahydrofolate deformylase [Pseudonocardia sp.]HTF52568.1 formyltetrahydrofolate deformylase [Pseudonocardia sp.]
MNAGNGDRRFVITFSCPDRTGIVARISGFLADAGGWITEAAYHTDSDTGWFFTRQVVRADSLPFDVDELRQRFAGVAEGLSERASWQVTDTGREKRVVLLVTKEGHCLHDLLGRASSGELPGQIVKVIGNSDALRGLVEAHGLPFSYVPFPEPGVNGDARATAFQELAAQVDEHDPHAIVLARFMQIVPAKLCEAWAGRALNIHHSFLPSFVGARPYHQAHARGVKLIGATCHYVTADLDAGPIIEQDVIRIDHGDTVTDMVRLGRDAEKLVLARGLRWHLEDRVLVQGNKTMVFA